MIVYPLKDKSTKDGFDIQMQANHLSHFILTSEVWPLLETAATKRGEARIVNHSSGAREGITFDKKYLEKNGGNLGGDGGIGIGKWRRYQHSKLANLLFTYALHDQIAQNKTEWTNKVKVLCAHPGPTNTGLGGKTVASGGNKLLDVFVIWSAVSKGQAIEDGSLGIIRACCDNNVQSGEFYGPSASTKGSRARPAVVLPPERKEQAEKELWKVSMQSTGIQNYFE